MDPPFYSAPASPAPTFPTGSFYSVRSNISISGRDQWNIITNNNVYSPTTISTQVYRWLSAIVPEANYMAALNARFENTGDWFLGGERFLRWKFESDSFLWVCGTTGCGKTVLSASIIDNVLGHCEADPSLACAYFFFDGRDGQPHSRLHESLLRSLIVQFSAQRETLPQALRSLYHEYLDGTVQPSLDSLQTVLLFILDLFAHAYIVVDSLDECTERDGLFDWIEGMNSWRRGKLHFLVTSRNEEDIAKRLRNYESVRMEPHLLARDIDLYLDNILQTKSAFQRWSDDVKSDIKDRLIRRAEGMFRLVSLQIEGLKNCFNKDELEDQLNCLPADLNEVYDRIVAGIPRKDRTNALKILQWLAFSFRPMQLQEIAHAVAVVPNSEHGLLFRPTRIYDDPRSALQVCSSLVTEIEGSITLAHMSVKDYLISRSHRDGATDFSINEKLSHSFIAQTCLAYLLRFSTLDIPNPVTIVKDFPLAEYAAICWISHVHHAGGDAPYAQQLLIEAFFQPHHSPPFVTWVRLWNIDDMRQDLEQSSANMPSPLYYASLSGVLHAVRSLLEKGADVNAHGGLYGNALQAAIFKDHEGVVDVLLQHANVNAQGGLYGNALQTALFKGNEQIVHALLLKGADINAQGGNYGNALQAAIHRGHDKIVTHLLESGADVNVPGGTYGNALQTAIHRGHVMIVKQLLQHGADITGHGEYSGNALQEALYEGHEAIVKLLLDKGADVNTLAPNALQDASYKGHEGVVKLLLKYGANGNDSDALLRAIHGGHDMIVQLLLTNGANANAQHGRALQEASHMGHEGIVKLLLQSGADVNAQGGFYGNALQAASTCGSDTIVKLLLERGADINAEGGHYHSALQAASFQGHETIVKFLIEKEVNVNAQGGFHGNALQAASHAGCEGIVKLLLEKGVNVNVQGGVYGHALQAASCQGHKNILQLLLEAGADVNAEGGGYGTSLQAAASQGHEEIVMLLLKSGAYDNVEVGFHGSALQAALKEGYEEIAKLLRQHARPPGKRKCRAMGGFSL